MVDFLPTFFHCQTTDFPFYGNLTYNSTWQFLCFFCETERHLDIPIFWLPTFYGDKVIGNKYYKHYHLEVQANPQKMAQKKTMLSMGETGLSHDIFFLNSQLGLRSLRSNDLRWWNFEAATWKVCNYSWKFGSLPWKCKVDLCMTNGSKVMFYLTLLYFLLQYLQEYSI